MALILELLGYVFVVVIGIVPIVNPFSTAPVFISMTAGVNVSERHKISTMACIYMGLLLLVFLFIGMLIMQFFGISLKSLRIAGGLVIAFMGFRMLFPPEHHDGHTNYASQQNPTQIAFTPLALPMLCGPGSISVVMTMATQVSQQTEMLNKIVGYIVVAVGIIISAIVCWMVLWSSGAVVRFLGQSGIDATTKLMGFLLICMGVEFILSGWSMV